MLPEEPCIIQWNLGTQNTSVEANEPLKELDEDAEGAIPHTTITSQVSLAV